MKSIIITLGQITNSLLKNWLIRLLMVDILLIFWYLSYNIECEPCLDLTNCPPCISKEQYFIIYFGLIVNLGFVIYFIYKKIKNK